MNRDEGYALLSVHFYGLADADNPGASRALLAGVEVHGFLPDITPDDVRVALLAMADTLPANLAEVWTAARAQTN